MMNSPILDYILIEGGRKMKGKLFVVFCAVIFGLCSLGYSQTVTAGGGGTFPTLSTAITSFRTGGSNALDPAPNVINCLDASYDELFPLIDVQLTINGKSGRSTLLGQNIATANDGFNLNVPAGEQVILNDLIFLPSTMDTPTDDMIDLNGGTGSKVIFNNCIISSNWSGAPASLDGFTVPGAAPSARVGDNGVNISNAAAEVNIDLNETVIVAASGPNTAGTPDNILLTGAAKNVLTINEGSVISFGGYRNIQHNNIDDLFIRGSASKPVYLINAEGVNYVSYTSTGILDIDHCIIANTTVGSNGANYCAGLWLADAPDLPTIVTNSLIINNLGPGLFLGNFNSTLVVKNVTISGNAGGTGTQDVAQVWAGTLGVSADISISDTIIAGGKPGILMTAGTIDLSYSALVLEGPQTLSIGVDGTGTVVETQVITKDPMFHETADLSSSDLFDVHNPFYGGKGSEGSNLSGGADYIGDYVPPVPLAAQNWFLYQ